MEIAHAAVETARASASGGCPGHVGYHLIDAGRAALEARFRYRPTVRQHLRVRVFRRPPLLYLGSIVLGTLAILAGTLIRVASPGADVIQLTPLLGLGLL